MRAIAGKRIEVACVQLGTDTRAGFFGEGSSGYELRAPKRSRPLPISAAPGNDYCSVSLRVETDRLLTFDTVVRVPITQAGAAALDEREKSGRLLFVLAAATDARGFITAERLTSRMWERSLRRAGISVVPLAAATDTPPAGRVGYWTDGAGRAAAVTLSAAGRRLYVELGPDAEMRTNITRSLFSIDE
jgi:hypothetical protein